MKLPENKMIFQVFIDRDIHNKQEKEITKVFNRNGNYSDAHVMYVIIFNYRKGCQYTVYSHKREQGNTICKVKFSIMLLKAISENYIAKIDSEKEKCKKGI